MTSWAEGTPYAGLADDPAASILSAIKPQLIAGGTVLFRPGDDPIGFVLVLSGRINVFLNSRTGRELLLYSIEPGETCVQTTLGILGAQTYTGEAIADGDVVAVVIPVRQFEALMEGSAAFRRFVFKAFAERLGEMTHLLEMVAFVRVERRLAQWLLDQSRQSDTVQTTHGDIASAIGSAREVVSRRLEALAARGIVSLERGAITVTSRGELVKLASDPDR